MSAAAHTILVASADRLFAEVAAHFIEDRTGHRTLTEGDGVRALMTITQAEPSAVLVLGRLARLDTDAFARRVRARWPSLHLVILGMPANGERDSLPLNADGPAVLAALFAPPPEIPSESEEPRNRDVALLRSLTTQERRILVLLGQGRGFRDIADRLSISEHTVRTHLQNLYRKLQVHSRLEVVRLAAQHGLIHAIPDEVE